MDSLLSPAEEKNRNIGRIISTVVHIILIALLFLNSFPLSVLNVAFIISFLGQTLLHHEDKIIFFLTLSLAKVKLS